YTSTQSDVQGHSYYTRYGRRKMMYELERPFLLTPDIGFQVTVNQFSYRSVLAFVSVTSILNVACYEQLIHWEVFSIPIENTRYLAQTTEDACDAESTPNAHCEWCWDSEKCIS
ncbi:hypothetical protein EWB00_005744, partial [Schistosoma japonicum]